MSSSIQWLRSYQGHGGEELEPRFMGEMARFQGDTTR